MVTFARRRIPAATGFPWMYKIAGHRAMALCLLLLASAPLSLEARFSSGHSQPLPRDPTKSSSSPSRIVQVASRRDMRGGFLGRRNKTKDKEEPKDKDNKGEDKPDDKDNTPQWSKTPAPQGVLLQASEFRQQGKDFHDSAEFVQAAETFGKAANLLEAKLQGLTTRSAGDGTEEKLEDATGENDEDGVEELEEELATCRLHESLCHLKGQQFQQCIAACTAILDSTVMSPPAMIRARAYHRRAKAKLGLEDTEDALVDARSAAFLGDRKAVVLYGKLMREHSGTSTPDFFAGKGDSTDPAQLSLLESLIKKSSPSKPGDDGSNLLASSLLGQLGGNPLGALLAPGGFAGSKTPGGGAESLAKSVLSSLSKTLEDETTHEKICTYLKSTNPMQVQSVAGMAGLQLSGDQASKLISAAHGVTPKTIRKTVKTTKAAVWGFKLLRKISKVISKYKNVIFLLFLLQWTKSAMLRPMPVPKIKAAKAPRSTMKPAASTTTTTTTTRTTTPKKPEPQATKTTTNKPPPPKPGAVIGGIL